MASITAHTTHGTLRSPLLNCQMGHPIVHFRPEPQIVCNSLPRKSRRSRSINSCISLETKLVKATVSILKSFFFAPLKQLCTGTSLSPMAFVGDKPASEVMDSAMRHSTGTHRQPEILSEAVFRRILRWEQHKTQRSMKSFLLLLMDVQKIVRGRQGQSALSEVLHVVTGSMRGADIAGWYLDNSVIGIIFSEVHLTDRSLLQSLICG